MKKPYLLIISTTLLASCSSLQSYKGPIFNGSDYVSTSTGTTYHYKRTSLDTGKDIFVDITINNCNTDKSICTHSTKVFDSRGKELEAYAMEYKLQNGDVIMTDKLYARGTLLLPARMELKKEINLQNQEKYGTVNEKLVVNKQIPTITINNHDYQNCINIIFETITPLKDTDLKIITDEIACKNIGTVKKEAEMLYRARTDDDINDNSFIPYQIYSDTLESITSSK